MGRSSGRPGRGAAMALGASKGRGARTHAVMHYGASKVVGEGLIKPRT